METLTTKTNEKTFSFEKTVDELLRERHESSSENESTVFNKEVFNQAAKVHQCQTDQAVSAACGLTFSANYALKGSTQRLFCVDHADKWSEIPSQSFLSIEDQQLPLINSWMWELETSQNRVAESFRETEFMFGQVPNLQQCQTASNVPTTHETFIPSADLGLMHSTQRNNRSKLESKPDMGLRSFSNKIMEKVQKKQVTSFEEVTSEILREMHDVQNKHPALNKDSKKKNIRRRVYDILNVMVAVGMIFKDKNNIIWIGTIATNGKLKNHLQQEVEELKESIKKKKAELQQLMLQQVAYKNLLFTKRDCEGKEDPQAASKKIRLPFITVNSSKNAVISHRTSSDKFEHVFDFEQPFQIHDNMEVLMRMGMAFDLENKNCSDQNLEIAKTMVSRDLEPYLVEMAKSGRVNRE